MHVAPRAPGAAVRPQAVLVLRDSAVERVVPIQRDLADAPLRLQAGRSEGRIAGLRRAANLEYRREAVEVSGADADASVKHRVCPQRSPCAGTAGPQSGTAVSHLGSVVVRAGHNVPDATGRAVLGIQPAVVVPGAVVEIAVVVGDLVAVQPVDGHAGPGGAGVVAGVDAGGAAEDVEVGAVGAHRLDAGIDAALHEGVVGGDVRETAVRPRVGDDQQAEPVARAEARGLERPVRGDDSGGLRLRALRGAENQRQRGGKQKERGEEEAPAPCGAGGARVSSGALALWRLIIPARGTGTVNILVERPARPCAGPPGSSCAAGGGAMAFT